MVNTVSTGVYLRVSTEEQAKEGYSIRAQEEKLRSYATAKDWHIYSVYADEGISSKDIDGRPAVKQLIADVMSGKVNNVLVYKIDRLTRSTKNLIELVELFNKYHCAFNSLNESIDTSTATGRMFLRIVGIFAEFERENLAERVRMGCERKVKEGYSLCSFIQSYGYHREKGNKIQDVETEEAAVVRRIFDMYLNDDYNYAQIARTLNAEGITTKWGKKWLNGTIRLLLCNPNYVGKVRYSMKNAERYFEVDGQHEPIIDAGTFNEAAAKMGRMKKVTRTKRPAAEVYFCGVLYCSVCGGKFSTKWGYFGERDGQHSKPATHPNYRCTNSVKGICAGKSMISHAKLERAFEGYISRVENFTERADTPADNAQTAKDREREQAAITADIARLEQKTAELRALFVASEIEFSDYQNMVTLSNERRGELEARLNQLETQTTQAARLSAAEIAGNLRDNWARLDNAGRLQFVQKFIKRLVIHTEAHEGGRLRDVIIDEVVFNEF